MRRSPRYWPEFAQAGKSDITTRLLLEIIRPASRE